MYRTLKFVLICLGGIVLVFAVLWCPYPSENVPEWRVQVIDHGGLPVVGAQATDEWIDPIEDGIIGAGSGTAGPNGWIVFPGVELTTDWQFQILNRRSRPSVQVVCWQGQFGDVFWDSPNWKLEHQPYLAVRFLSLRMMCTPPCGLSWGK